MSAGPNGLIVPMATCTKKQRVRELIPHTDLTLDLIPLRLFKEWTMSSVRSSNSGCTRIVGRARGSVRDARGAA